MSGNRETLLEWQFAHRFRMNISSSRANSNGTQTIKLDKYTKPPFHAPDAIAVFTGGAFILWLILLTLHFAPKLPRRCLNLKLGESCFARFRCLKLVMQCFFTFDALAVTNRVGSRLSMSNFLWQVLCCRGVSNLTSSVFWCLKLVMESKIRFCVPSNKNS